MQNWNVLEDPNFYNQLKHLEDPNFYNQLKHLEDRSKLCCRITEFVVQGRFDEFNHT